MSKHIDHSNYEAYFIDYLEGALSGELQAEMETFMEENPEINFDLDVDGLILQAPKESLDTVVKLALKKEVAISELNTESLPYFAIASLEGQLSDSDLRAFENWLAENEDQRPIFNSYFQTRIEATSIIYGNKKALKRNTLIIPLWVKGSAIAASLALLITLGWNDQMSTTKGISSRTSVAQTTKSADKKMDVKATSNKVNDLPSIPSNTNTVVTNTTSTDQRVNETLAQEVIAAELPIRQLELEHTCDLVAGNYSYEKSPYNEDVPIREDLSWVPLESMRNPIAPLTNKLTETLNTTVDFRTAKGTKNCGNGFLVKIGKFELSHRSACR